MIETVGTILLWIIGIVGIVGGAVLWLIDGEATRIGGGEPSRLPKIMVLVGAVVTIMLLSGCTTTPVYGDIPECERMIPGSLTAPTPGVPIPESEEAEPWMQAFVGQTGQLDKANDKAPAVDHIYRTCLVLHREALARAKRGFFGRLFGR